MVVGVVDVEAAVDTSGREIKAREKGNDQLVVGAVEVTMVLEEAEGMREAGMMANGRLAVIELSTPYT